MGFVAFANNSILEKLKSLSDNECFSFGLVIAEEANGQTHITHLTPLPSPLGIEEEVSDEQDTKPKISSSKPCKIASVAETAVATHAYQVVRMLPGGLDVVGVYTTTPLSEINNSATQGKLRILLTAIHKVTSKFYLGTSESSLQKLLLFGCTETSKVGVKTIDLFEQGTSFITATLKAEESNWIQLNYNYLLSYPIYIPKEKASQSVSKNVLTSFRPWAKSLQEALILIDGKTMSEEEELLPDEESSTKKKGATSNRKQSSVKCFDIQILEQQNLPNDNDSTELVDCSGSILFTGTVAGRAFVNSKATASDAFGAVRKDLIRSLVSRWEMHCDSLIEEPQGSTSDPVLHEPPRRVFLKGDESPISLCDYLFPGDSVSDACQSAKEVLDLSFQQEQVDDSAEKWADPEEFRSPETLLSSYDDEKCYEEIAAVKRSSVFQVVTIIVGLLAVVMSYFFITSKA